MGLDFIYDRTDEDVMYAQSLMTANWNTMTNEQKAEWLKGLDTPLESLKGFFNYTDMVRIGTNFNTIKTHYSSTGQSDINVNAYTMNTIPNLTSMSADFEKIRQVAILSQLPRFVGASFVDYRTPQSLSSSVNRIDYNFLNNYERLLKMLYDNYEESGMTLECDYLIDESKIELDGYLYSSGSSIFPVRVPKGYIGTYEIGVYADDEFTPSETVKANTGTWHNTEIDAPNSYFHFKIESGVESENLVLDFGTGGNSIDVTDFDEVNINSNMLQYETSVNYEASAVQSDFVDVSSKISLYLYNSSDYSGNIIITTYDELQDTIDEFALTEDMFIDLTNVSYFTIDSEVGDTLSYLLSSGTTLGQIVVFIGEESSAYPTYNDFDVSEVNSFKLMYPAPLNYKFVATVRKSITDGKDIGQLNIDDIEVLYV